MPVTFSLAQLEADSRPLAPRELSVELEARGVRGALAGETDGPLVEALSLHGLVMAFHLAFTRHRPLVLSPDSVWLCVAQGLARHVELHAEELRSRLVAHAGKLALEVRHDALSAEPSSVQEWASAVDGLTQAVRHHLGPRADLFGCDFSTTSRASRTASQIALLGAMQRYFEYRVASLCGIPEVTLEGTVGDWADLRRRARVLGEFDLGWWSAALEPVLAKLEETAAGRPDLDFWRSAYKRESASGGEAVSGWVNALFPYLREGLADPNPWFSGGDALCGLELPKLKDFPAGLTSAPFAWRRLDGERPMRLVAGFLGVSRKGEAVAPAIGWAVAPDAPPRLFRALDRGDGLIEMTPRDAATLGSLESLSRELASEGHRRICLSLSWCQRLTSLDGLAGVGALEELGVLGCDHLERVDALSGAPGIRVLSVAQCPGPIDLTPLSAMSGLVRLSLAHNPAITGLGALASLDRLEQLDLFGEGIPPEVAGRHLGHEAVARVQAALRR
jgi:hypothetical protein